MSRLHNLERSISNQGQVPGDATNAVTVSCAHKGLMLVVNAIVVKLFILSLTWFLKWSLVGQLSMCWWLGGLAHRRAGLSSPLSEGLSTLTLPLPGTSGHAQPPLLASSCPKGWSRSDVLHATFGQDMRSRLASGLAVPSAVGRWLWGVNLPPTADLGTQFIRVQRSQSLGGHLWEGRLSSLVGYD